jgi:hypothetical protein
MCEQNCECGRNENSLYFPQIWPLGRVVFSLNKKNSGIDGGNGTVNRHFSRRLGTRSKSKYHMYSKGAMSGTGKYESLARKGLHREIT